MRTGILTSMLGHACLVFEAYDASTASEGARSAILLAHPLQLCRASVSWGSLTLFSELSCAKDTCALTDRIASMSRARPGEQAGAVVVGGQPSKGKS